MSASEPHKSSKDLKKAREKLRDFFDFRAKYFSASPFSIGQAENTANWVLNIFSPALTPALLTIIMVVVGGGDQSITSQKVMKRAYIAYNCYQEANG
jgi:hypothetical protein